MFSQLLFNYELEVVVGVRQVGPEILRPLVKAVLWHCSFLAELLKRVLHSD